MLLNTYHISYSDTTIISLQTKIYNTHFITAQLISQFSTNSQLNIQEKNIFIHKVIQKRVEDIVNINLDILYIHF